MPAGMNDATSMFDQNMINFYKEIAFKMGVDERDIAFILDIIKVGVHYKC